VGDLREAVNEVVRGYFFDAPEQLLSRLRVHLVRDEIRREVDTALAVGFSPLVEFFGSVDCSIKDHTNAGTQRAGLGCKRH
jgi:hypothetical protein